MDSYLRKTKPWKFVKRRRLVNYLWIKGFKLKTRKFEDIFSLLVIDGAIPENKKHATKHERSNLMISFWETLTDPKYNKTLNHKNPWMPGAKEKKKSSHKSRSDKFFASREWKELRYKVLTRYGQVCMLCGDRPPDCVIHVDHIKPRLKFPHLELDEDNLQVLCGDCNMGKSYKYQDDFREMQEMDERFRWIVEHS